MATAPLLSLEHKEDHDLETASTRMSETAASPEPEKCPETEEQEAEEQEADEPTKCPNCGKKLMDRPNFCPSCANPIIRRSPSQKHHHELDSHWKWFAVDIRKQNKIASKMQADSVRKIRKELKALKREGIFIEDGRSEVKVVKLRDMQTLDETYFRDIDVVVQQHVDQKGAKPWQLIVRIPKVNPLVYRLQERSCECSTDSLALFSGLAGLVEAGASIGNDDMPVAFTGYGGVPEDFLVHTTAYEKFGGDHNTIPEKIFEVSDKGEMLKLRSQCGGVRQDFYFNDAGRVQEAGLSFLDGYYYARVVTKGWWFQVQFWAFATAILSAVDWYNNVTFVFHAIAIPKTSNLAYVFGGSIVLFSLLEWSFCYLLAHEDMEMDIHKDDMALGEVNFFGRLHPFQTFLYYFRVPVSVKEMVIWTCPRGASMGRAVAKVNKARSHIMTWPTKSHYECDVKRGMHQIFPLLLSKNMILMFIQLAIYWKGPGGLLAFSAYFWPKFGAWVYSFYSYMLTHKNREHLRAWLLSKWNKVKPDAAQIEMPHRGMNEYTQLKTLFGVYEKHFRDASKDLWNYKWYNHLAPYRHHGHRFRQLPLIAWVTSMALIMICFIIAAVFEHEGKLNGDIGLTTMTTTI